MLYHVTSSMHHSFVAQYVYCVTEYFGLCIPSSQSVPMNDS